MPTAQEIITLTQEDLGEVAGPGVQVYGEDTLLNKVRQCFEMILLKHNWSEFLHYEEVTLDGVTGLVNGTAFQSLLYTHDVVGIFWENSNTYMPSLSFGTNPLLLKGNKALCWQGLPASHPQYAMKRLQFWPKTATGTYMAVYKTRPLNIVPDTELYLDQMLLKLGTTWMALAGEGINAEATATFRELFNMRFKDIQNALAAHPIEGLGNPDRRFLTEWSAP